MTIGETTDMTGVHAHVYFDEATRGAAEPREKLTPRFALYELAFAGDQFAVVVPGLMLSRGG